MLLFYRSRFSFVFFFFNDTATTEIYTLSLHDALPIYQLGVGRLAGRLYQHQDRRGIGGLQVDRKSTRLNSSHTVISYAVFCLKKKKRNTVQLGIAAKDRECSIIQSSEPAFISDDEAAR